MKTAAVSDPVMASVAYLESLIEKIRAGQVVGVTVVLTESSGAVRLDPLFFPEPKTIV